MLCSRTVSLPADDFVAVLPGKILCLPILARLVCSGKQKATTSFFFFHLLTLPKRFKAPVSSSSLPLFSLISH